MLVDTMSTHSTFAPPSTRSIVSVVTTPTPYTRPHHIQSCTRTTLTPSHIHTRCTSPSLCTSTSTLSTCFSPDSRCPRAAPVVPFITFLFLFIALHRNPSPPHGTKHHLACISFVIFMYRYLSSHRATYSVVDNPHALYPAICNLPTHRFRSLFAVGPLPTLMYTTAFVSLSPHIHRMALLKFVPLLCMMSARRVRCLRDVRKELSART